MKLRKMYIALDVASLVLAAAFFYCTACKYFDYKAHPEIYMIQSAPWYTSLIPMGLIFAFILILIIIAKIIIKKKSLR